MTLTLSLRSPEAAPEGVTREFTVEGDVAVIGRSKNCDWNLPDPGNIVSSRHAEIRRDGDGWVLKDISTNGTFLNGAGERMAGEHVIADGDVFRIGQYDVVASLAAKALVAPPPPEPEPPPAAEPIAERTVIAASAEAAAAEPADQPPENVTVMWDSLADINKVDWARGGLGIRDEAAVVAAGDDPARTLLAAAGVGEADIAPAPDLTAKAGALLKRLIAGLVVMVEARARAKAQMGAEATGLQLEGNNPIKFARSPDQALAQLLNPAAPGFMEADRAVEDAFLDLQSHQVATLRAIPGALRATLDRFSPGAIRRRAEAGGFLDKIMPNRRDAALWRSYEREYVKVKNESDEAFMEVFAREFRRAYERQLREGFEEVPENRRPL